MNTTSPHFYYQVLLSDIIEERKKKNPSYSLRSLASFLGINSATLSSIIKGSRALSQEKALEIAQKLNFDNTTKRLFTWGTIKKEDKPETLEEYILDREIISEDKKNIIIEWQHLAILQLFKCSDFKSDTSWIAQRLGINEDLVLDSLKILTQEGLIQENDQNQWIRTSLPITTASKTKSENIRNAHRERLKLAMEKISLPIELRNYSFSNIAIDIESVEEFKNLTRKYLKEIEHLAAKSKKNEVYQLSLQFFPLTKMDQHEEN